LTNPAQTKIAVNIQPCKGAEYSLSNRRMLARKQPLSIRVGAKLIICNNVIRQNTGECEQ